MRTFTWAYPSEPITTGHQNGDHWFQATPIIEYTYLRQPFYLIFYAWLSVTLMHFDWSPQEVPTTMAVVRSSAVWISGPPVQPTDPHSDGTENLCSHQTINRANTRRPYTTLSTTAPTPHQLPTAMVGPLKPNGWSYLAHTQTSRIFPCTLGTAIITAQCHL